MFVGKIVFPKTGVAYLVDKTTMNLKTTFGASMVANTMLDSKIQRFKKVLFD